MVTVPARKARRLEQPRQVPPKEVWIKAMLVDKCWKLPKAIDLVILKKNPNIT